MNRGIIREKSDADLFSVDDVGTQPGEPTEVVEPPKKRRKPLHVDQVLGITEQKLVIPSHIPKSQRQRVPAKPEVPEQPKESYNVWTREEVIPAPEGLPPPATLPYGKKLPALPPPSLRSKQRLLRTTDTAVKVADPGQSYNPTLEEWEVLIDRTASEEKKRLEDIARKEWVPHPEDVETPAHDQESSDEEEETTESYLGKPVQVKRKTRAQRNKEARHAEQQRLRQLAEKAKAKRRQVDNLPSILSQIAKVKSSARTTKKVKELPVAPLEIQLSDELSESLRLLKPEGNLFRDRFRSIVERGMIEPRMKPVKKGRKYPIKYVEKYDYKHWGKYYGK